MERGPKTKKRRNDSTQRQKSNQNPPRHPSSSGSANSLFRIDDERGPARDRLWLRCSFLGFSRSLACGRKDRAASLPAPSTMAMGGWPVEGKCIGSGGTVLPSDSSDSDDRSRTSGGICCCCCCGCWCCCQPTAAGAGSDDGRASRKACGWSAAPWLADDLCFLWEDWGWEEEGAYSPEGV